MSPDFAASLALRTKRASSPRRESNVAAFPAITELVGDTSALPDAPEIGGETSDTFTGAAVGGSCSAAESVATFAEGRAGSSDLALPLSNDEDRSTDVRVARDADIGMAGA